MRRTYVSPDPPTRYPARGRWLILFGWVEVVVLYFPLSVLGGVIVD